VRRVLESYWYEVVEASSGEEGLHVFRDLLRLDLVIADLVMPGLQGDEMVQRISAQRPHVKVLYVTGYADTLFDRLGTLPKGQAFLDKPLTADGLAEAVSLLLYGTIWTPPWSPAQ